MIQMIHTEVGFSLKSEFKNIVLTQKLVLFLNKDYKKIVLTIMFLLPLVIKACRAKLVKINFHLNKTFKQT